MVLWGLLNRLDERDRHIIVLHFFDNESQETIAERMGVTQSHISRIVRRALLEMRTDLSSSDFSAADCA